MKIGIFQMFQIDKKFKTFLRDIVLTIESIVNTKELITLPTIATNVLRMLESDNTDIRDITNIIQLDPALSIKILKIANSPFYATRREITSIHQAVMLIGFNKLINIILGVSIFSKFWLSTKPGAEELMNHFWLHSCSTGTLAKFIVRKINKNFNESEFIGGLLYQIGKLIMIQYDINRYKQVIELIEKNSLTDIEAEKEIYGFNHIEVGSHLAKLWKLPDDIRLVISNYYNPQDSEENKELIASVNLAGIISEQNGYGFYKGIANISLDSTDAWKILVDSYPPLNKLGESYLLSGIEEEFAKSKDFLNNIK